MRKSPRLILQLDSDFVFPQYFLDLFPLLWREDFQDFLLRFSTPFFPFKFLAFSIGYPMWKWVTALVVARFPRYYLLALLGATVPVPNWILIASVAVVFGLYLVKAIPEGYKRLKARRRAKT